MEIINVLSYNVSWGCMTNNPGDATAMTVAEQCIKLSEEYQKKSKKKDVFTCLFNIINVINKAIKKEETFDFIGTQESSWNWLRLYHQSAAIKKMDGYVRHNFLPMVSFYDSNKYKLYYIKVGRISGSHGRPYQILFLKHRATQENFIFINIHNGHGDHFTKNKVIDSLCANLNNCIDVSQSKKTEFDLCHNCDEKKKKIFDSVKEDNLTTQITNFINPKVIFVGDTNNSNFWKGGFTPFAKSSFPNLKDITLTIPGETNPVKTCCVGKGSLRIKEGDDTCNPDIIMISDNLLFTQRVKVPDKFEYNATITPTSDHLPILGQIRRKEPMPAVKTIFKCKKIPLRKKGGGRTKKNIKSIKKNKKKLKMHQTNKKRKLY